MMKDAIDLAVFRELQDTAGADFVGELVETFFEEAPSMLAELREARAAADAERFRRAAHSLKSNSNTFGATMLGRLARALELKGLDADPAADDAAVAALEVAYADAADMLRELVRG
jgi:HPt (histidine-containing phosphotransfer) domain-containing protein